MNEIVIVTLSVLGLVTLTTIAVSACFLLVYAVVDVVKHNRKMNKLDEERRRSRWGL